MKIKDIVLVLLVFVVGYLFWLNYHREAVSAYTATEFTGHINKVNGQTIAMRGNFNVAGHPELLGEKNAVDVNVGVTAETKFVKIIIHRPLNLTTTSGVVDPKKLRQEIVAGKLEDLAGGKVDGATVIANGNIYGKSKFDASTITYYVAVTDTK